MKFADWRDSQPGPDRLERETDDGAGQTCARKLSVCGHDKRLSCGSKSGVQAIQRKPGNATPHQLLRPPVSSWQDLRASLTRLQYWAVRAVDNPIV
jgi:hypothetical protein